MAYDRDDDGYRGGGDYGRNYGSGRDYGYSSARDYRAAGEGRGGDDRNFRGGGTGYGGGYERERGDDRGGRYGGYGAREGGESGSRYGAQGYGGSYGGDRGGGYGRGGYGGSSGGYGGSYASDGQRFSGQGDRDDRNDRGGRQGGGYGRPPQGYDPSERGFFERAGDEVRSWFGDEEAERRRDFDQRYDEREGGRESGRDRDLDYGSWRRTQIAALDRDYDEYRRENASRFENEFGSWRTQRQGQRDSLSRVEEHMDVVGSDGEHVGTVDKIRGDRIILTKNDEDAGGRHHSIPSSWLSDVSERVTLSKSAAEAKRQWRDEERSGKNDDEGRTDLGRSFSGTYQS